MPERERIVEAAVAVVTVLVMLAAMAWIGLTYGTEATLGEDGPYIMIAAIVGFIFLVTAVGVALAYVVSDPSIPDDEDDADAEATT